ncbi:MAG: diguanylate cyclase [Geobacter sp.]|nr:diguanylate cyclase [Geobacter sp.]
MANMKRHEREQLVFLQTMIDTVPAPIYYKDREGRYLGCNRAFEVIHGRTRQELVGRTIFDIAPRAIAEEIAAEDAELFQQTGGQFQILEKSLIYADGSPHDVIFYKDAFREEDGTAAGLVGVIIDITRRKTVEMALHAQREFSENLLQNSAVPCFVLDINHCVLTWTRACEELTGITAAEVLGADDQWRAFYPSQRPCLADLILDGDIVKTHELYLTISTSPLIPDGLQAEGWFPNIGGRRRYLLFEAAPIRDGSGNLIAAIETLNDLTRLKLAEEALKQSEASYRSLIEQSPDAILVHHGGEVIFGNLAAARLFGAGKPDKFIGARIIDLLHQSYHEPFMNLVTQVEELGEARPYVEQKIVRLDGTNVDVEVGLSPVFYGGTRAVQTIVRDITERKELQERIWRQANFDPLTGIPNRLLFMDRLQQALDQAERGRYHVALFFIDLDRFKDVNDSLGHGAGDELLHQVAERLTSVLRKTDTVARMGGDEFTIIMPRIVEPPTVTAVAERILARLSAPFLLPGGEGNVSGSIGIAFYPEDGPTAPALLTASDKAMYKSKESGRATYTFATPGLTIRDDAENNHQIPEK